MRSPGFALRSFLSMQNCFPLSRTLVATVEVSETKQAAGYEAQ